ncbi:hypothetical protein [Leuconostoc gasicomitatum]|uniref:hypothetical protein n=1 Tax=Leuconostoc gasicomitatum TaxID=115778 RepID=UPI000744B74D|nr:hypothetical protein [Leuconostoc gasicomitatum]CUR63422.1 Uncharacterized protein LEKG_0835 [Leuconostoc gasicomitatum KG16-1]
MAAAGPQIKKTGKIVRIISKDEVIVNLGSKDSIYQGQGFEIIKQGEHIIDPENGLDLGGFPFTVATLNAYFVEESFSVLRTQAKAFTPFNNFPGTSPLVSVEFTHINVDEDSIEPLIELNDTKIVVGDIVKTI